MSVKRIRKTAADFADDHDKFLLMIADRRPELEIAVCLELSAVQFRAHTLDALKKQEVTPDDLKPSYEAVYAKGLPKAVRELMSLESDDDGEALVKVELQDNAVLLTLLRAASPRTQSRPEDTEESPVTDDADEESA